MESYQPRIQTIAPITVIGMTANLCFADNKISDLWRCFRARQNEITAAKDGNSYSIKVYDETYHYRSMTPQTRFNQWASVAVSAIDQIPEGMHAFAIPAGQYAVFLHQGPMAQFRQTLHFIHETWLPQAGLTVDNRPHFEILPPGWSPFDPNASEQVWVPIVQ